MGQGKEIWLAREAERAAAGAPRGGSWGGQSPTQPPAQLDTSQAYLCCKDVEAANAQFLTQPGSPCSVAWIMQRLIQQGHEEQAEVFSQQLHLGSELRRPVSVCTLLPWQNLGFMKSLLHDCNIHNRALLLS